MFLQVRGPFRAAGRMDLVPEARDLAEAHLLVVVDLIDRPRLDDGVAQQRLEVAVEVRDGLQPELRGLERVHLRDAGLLQVRGRPHLVQLRLAEQRGHDVGTLRAELEAVDAVGLAPAHPLARLLRRLDRAAIPAGARTLVVDDARGDDLVARAPRLLADGERVVGKRDAGDGGDAVRHPQLVGVLRVRVLGRSARVHVVVDEAGHHVHAGGVDLLIGVLRRPVRPRRDSGRAGAANRVDAVAGDDDVDGTDRRGAGAVDHDGVADDERLERAASFARLPRRRRHDRLRLVAGGRRLLRPARCKRARRPDDAQRHHDDCRANGCLHDVSCADSSA